MELINGTTVFVSKTEQLWPHPITMKRHHVYETRTVILRGTVVDSKDRQMKVELFGNNGFEKDGQVFVFSKDDMLCNQDFRDFKRFGVCGEVSKNNGL